MRVSLRSHVIRLIFYGISGQLPLGDDDDDDIGSHDDEGNARTSTNKLGFTNKTTLFLLGPVHHTFLANFL